MNDYRTVPNQALKKTTQKAQAAPTQKHPAHYIPSPRPSAQQPMRRPKPKSKFPRWLLLLPMGFFALMMLFIGGFALVVFLSYSNSILPRVQLGDIELGGLSQEEAAQVLSQNWGNLL